VRKSFKYDKAVLGINLGTLGFLTDVSMEQLPSFIDDSKNDIILRVASSEIVLNQTY
jgi:NAD+ kinase